MHTRRLDDRIRLLCRKLGDAGDGEDIEPLVQALLRAIHEKVGRIRNLAVKVLVEGESSDERRGRQT
jgi:hypothetical protein